MSVYRQGVWSKSAGVRSAITKQLKSLTFKPVDKITIQFDPFEERSNELRDLLSYVSTQKIQKTNLSCLLKTNIVCDRSEPVVTCNLTSGEKIIFKCANLDTLDILKLYNEHISSLVPYEEPVAVTSGRLKKKKKLRVKIKVPRHRK